MRPLVILALCAACAPDAPAERVAPDRPERPDLTDVVPTPSSPTEETTEPVEQIVCDAGTDAWVQRVFPVLLGRKPHGAAEIQMWSAMADAHGRAVVTRALTQNPDYYGQWEPLLDDMILVSRSGTDPDYTCFEDPMLSNHDGSLAAYIADHRPDAGRFGTSFNMSDVVRDALVADRLDVVWQANIFARTNYVPYCGNSTDPDAIESERRVALGDEFLSVYLDRDLTCISCHNSEFSTTDNADPALDRTWGMPGLLELALFETSAGPLDPESYYAVHRYEDVVRDLFGRPLPQTPWGMDGSCGSFRRVAPSRDALGVTTTYFGGPLDEQATLWDLEAMLSRGATSLTGTTLAIQADGTVASDEALAWLTASHIVDQVWELALGQSLTVPYGFSRNEAQQQQLQHLTEVFLAEGWSLRELLVAITTSEAFNAGLPATCGGTPYSLPPIIDPYAVEEPDVSKRGNGAGDLVHRHHARTLLRVADKALEFPPRDEFFPFLFGADQDEFDLQAAMGVMLQKGQAGFNGTDFQGALAWENAYATCRDDGPGAEFLVRAIQAAGQQGVTVEELALAVKDRLTGRALWDDDTERELVEDLLDEPLSAIAPTTDPTFARKLGLFCGALTLSPGFFLTVEPLPSGPVPALDLGWEADCARLVTDMATQGITLTCDGYTPQ